MAEMVQVTLQAGTSHRVCWVPTEKHPRVGGRITLKNSEDPAKLWNVRTIGEPKDSSHIATDWHVGGL